MILNIQALRALAVYLVVLVHTRSILNGTPGQSLPLGFGLSGVDIFFVISGLIMVVTTDHREFRPGDFIWHRIVRIVPLYWLMTLLVFGVALVAPTLVQATKPSPVELLKSLFFIPFVKSNGLLQPIVFVGWTLNCEMFFYVLFAFSLFVASRDLRIGLMIAALTGLTLAGVVIGGTNPYVGFYTSPLLLEFGAGVLLGAFRDKLPVGRGWLIVATAATLVGGALIVAGPVYWQNLDRAISCGIPALMIVSSALVFERAGYVVRAKWIGLLGAASYSIYLTHFFVTQVSTKLAHNAHVHSLILGLGIMAITAVACALVGIAVHLYIELPLTRFARHHLTFSPARPAPGRVSGTVAP